MKIARHPQLSRDQSFIEFLQVEGELPKVSGVSILSGAGIAKLIGKVGDSINKMTYTLPESDQVSDYFPVWFFFLYIFNVKLKND